MEDSNDLENSLQRIEISTDPTERNDKTDNRGK